MTRPHRIAIAVTGLLLIAVLLAGELWFLLDRPPAALSYCDAETSCPQEQECYVFEDLDTPVCWEGDPCTRCASGRCAVMESYPMQIRCE